MMSNELPDSKNAIEQDIIFFDVTTFALVGFMIILVVSRCCLRKVLIALNMFLMTFSF